MTSSAGAWHTQTTHINTSNRVTWLRSFIVVIIIIIINIVSSYHHDCSTTYCVTVATAGDDHDSAGRYTDKVTWHPGHIITVTAMWRYIRCRRRWRRQFWWRRSAASTRPMSTYVIFTRENLATHVDRCRNFCPVCHVTQPRHERHHNELITAITSLLVRWLTHGLRADTAWTTVAQCDAVSMLVSLCVTACAFGAHWLLVNFSQTVANESAPIQLAQCRFPGLAISNAKILIYFSNKIYGSNFIKPHSETVMVWNYQNADCSLRRKFYCVIYCNFRHIFVPYTAQSIPALIL